MGNFPDPSPDAVRLPPTKPPKRRKQRPRWVQPVVVVTVVALAAILVSAVLNREVSRRLATAPPPTTPTTTTSTTMAPPPSVPVTTAQVLGARVSRPASPAATTTTTTAAPPVEPEFREATPSEFITALEKLPVEQEHRQNYRRGQFGYYRDADRDGCETRLEVAIAEAISIVTGDRCSIESGKWFSPFDGKTSTNQAELDVTHLVSLRETWESGAWRWNDAKRNEYLNDLAHAETLLVVTAASATARNDEDPGGWMPSNKEYLCDYLKTWVYLKTLYKLSVDAGERETIAAAATGC